jgi:hypothetical protein
VTTKARHYRRVCMHKQRWYFFHKWRAYKDSKRQLALIDEDHLDRQIAILEKIVRLTSVYSVNAVR